MVAFQEWKRKKKQNKTKQKKNLHYQETKLSHGLENMAALEIPKCRRKSNLYINLRLDRWSEQVFFKWF